MTEQNATGGAARRVRVALRAAHWAWWQLRRPTTLGVRLLLCPDAGSIVLVRHTYLNGLYLPGGGVQRGESFPQAAQREAHEELGITIPDAALRVLGVYFSQREAKHDHIVTFTASHWDGTPTPNCSEIAQLVIADVSDLPADATPATRRRVAELHNGLAPSHSW